ncbi:MAG: hypothetical protein QOE07_1117 [Acidimicrobiaceae bacterium]|nr:hypothetical protein [Acidimicrobiaceae bacterium]
MLDEDEWAEVSAVLSAARLPGEGPRERPDKVLEIYERFTGRREKNFNAVMHHRASHYGPPCQACGRPLRTPRASFCAACGAVRSESAE